MNKNRETLDRKFGWRDKLGYLFGDFGNDFTYLLSTMMLSKFYTDVMGISAGVVGTVMMLARFVDAFTDVTMGRICDRSKPTAAGKFKPWLLRMCVPVTAFARTAPSTPCTPLPVSWDNPCPPVCPVGCWRPLVTAPRPPLPVRFSLRLFWMVFSISPLWFPLWASLCWLLFCGSGIPCTRSRSMPMLPLCTQNTAVDFVS